VPYVVGLCSKGTPQASQAGSCSMPRPIWQYYLFCAPKDFEHIAKTNGSRTLDTPCTLRVEKVALFCNPASGGMFSSTAIEIIKWVKFFAVAGSLWKLRGRLDFRCRPLPGPESYSEEKKQVGAPTVPLAVFRGSIEFEYFWCQRRVKGA
jgi:hypothetical protein